MEIAYAIQFSDGEVRELNYDNTIIEKEWRERDERGKTTHGERRKIRNSSRRKTRNN